MPIVLLRCTVVAIVAQQHGQPLWVTCWACTGEQQFCRAAAAELLLLTCLQHLLGHASDTKLSKCMQGTHSLRPPACHAKLPHNTHNTHLYNDAHTGVCGRPLSGPVCLPGRDHRVPAAARRVRHESPACGPLIKCMQAQLHARGLHEVSAICQQPCRVSILNWVTAVAYTVSQVLHCI